MKSMTSVAEDNFYVKIVCTTLASLATSIAFYNVKKDGKIKCEFKEVVIV